MPDTNAAYAAGVSSVAAGAHAVELLPEKTGRLGTRTSIGPRLAFVIDSTPAMRTIDSTLLEVHGFTVQAFEQLDEAVQACRAAVPHVVVMEPRTAGSDPLDVLARWHRGVAPAEPPVVWCTTVTPSAEHLARGPELGLRGVVIKPFRLEALAALVVRVVRTDEREARLRQRGVDLRRIGGVLPPAAALAWLEVECELAEAHVRPLSVVSVAASQPVVARAVRSVIRNVDLVALLDEATAGVLLPDVDEAGAAVVAQRVRSALSGLEPPPAVAAVTRQPGEAAAELLSRALLAG
jgi:two-component system chemotaxis response regulator CheY